MYKYLFIIVVAIISISGCTKDEHDEIPTGFTKRVLMDEITGEWCSSCVSGANLFNEILSDNPGTVFGVAHHFGDPLQVKKNGLSEFLLVFYHINSLPSALIDRIYDNELSWNTQVQSRLQEQVDAGLKIESSIEGYELNVTVTCLSHRELGDVLLTVFLVEDNVKESEPGAQKNGGGNYVHRHVLRKVLSYKKGDPVTLNKDVEIKKSYSVNIGQYKKDDLQIVAFIHYGRDKGYTVINTNGTKAGETGTW